MRAITHLGGWVRDAPRSGNLPDDVTELQVGHRTLLCRAKRLHLFEDSTVLFGGGSDAELVELDLDVGKPALLAQRDAAAGGQNIGRVGLNGRRHMELRR